MSAVRSKASPLTHVRADGSAQMVDVSGKPVTLREAEAQAEVRLGRAALAALRDNPKGNVLEVARIAGITAAKRTAELIPLCHNLPLTHIDVCAELCQNGIELISEATTTGPTGVEMEALVAASVAALTIYDMCKALERGMEITQLYVVEKSGGRSGRYVRPSPRKRN